MKFAALLLIAAACSPWDYVTKHGIGVRGEDVEPPPKALLTAAVDAMLADVPGPNERLDDWLSGAEIHFNAGEPMPIKGRGFRCGWSAYEWCAGYTRLAERSIVLVKNDCLGVGDEGMIGGLVHEFGHVIQHVRDQFVDYDHVNTDYFHEACVNHGFADDEVEEFRACWDGTFEDRLNAEIAQGC